MKKAPKDSGLSSFSAPLDYGIETQRKPTNALIFRAFGILLILLCLFIVLFITYWFGSRPVVIELDSLEANRDVARVLSGFNQHFELLQASSFQTSGPVVQWYRLQMDPSELKSFKDDVITAWTAHPDCSVNDDDDDPNNTWWWEKDYPEWWQPAQLEKCDRLVLIDSHHIEAWPYWLAISSETNEVYLYEVVGWRGRDAIKAEASKAPREKNRDGSRKQVRSN